jgi:hypothetical protein
MTIRCLVALAAVGASLAGVAACSAASAHSAAPGSTGTTCGTTRTGANVPVVIKVTKGSVSCASVMRVESGYATVIKDGKLTGNGGGAPVQVSGWTCQGYPTPEVLRTGNASECHTASAEVVAVVELPSSSGS